MIFHFTCACGNAASVVAESRWAALLALGKSGWEQPGPGNFNSARCPTCGEMEKRDGNPVVA